MHISFLDPFRDGDSPVHKLDSRIKFLLVICFIVTTSLTENGNWPAFILLTAIIFTCEIVSEFGLLFYLKRALLAFPFIMAALPVLITVEGNILISFPFHLAVTDHGLARFFSIGLKSWISIQAAILLSTTTRFPDILMAMRSIGLPRLLVAIIGLMWRYLFVIADEALRLIRARLARSGESSQPKKRTGGSVIWRAKVTGGMAGSLFLRSLERSDRIYSAMIARGYDGEVRCLPHPPISRSAWITLSIGLFVFSLILFIGLLF